MRKRDDFCPVCCFSFWILHLRCIKAHILLGDSNGMQSLLMPARNSTEFMAEHPALALSHSVNVLMHHYRVQHTMHVLLGKADLQPTDHRQTNHLHDDR